MNDNKKDNDWDLFLDDNNDLLVPLLVVLLVALAASVIFV